MAFEWKPVGAFGGGVDFTKHPSALREDQWSFSTGWYALDGVAETANDLVELAVLPISGTGGQIIGMVQNPFGQDGALVGVVTPSGGNSTGAARLFRVDGAGNVTEITDSGVPGLSGNNTAVLQAAFIGGYSILSFGYNGTGQTTARVKNPPTTYDVLDLTGPGGGLIASFHYLTGFADHIVAGCGSSFTPNLFGAAADDGRTAYWSSSNIPSFDIPSISNDADSVTMDDVNSGLVVIAPVGNTVCALMTRSSISILQPTGSIPAFTRQLLVQGLGAFALRQKGVPGNNFQQQSFWGTTPCGVAFCGQDDLYLISGGATPRPFGTPLFRYYSSLLIPIAVPTSVAHQTFVWHEALGMLMVPRPLGATNEMFYFDPITEAWSALLYSPPFADLYRRSAFIYSYNFSGNISRKLWVSTVDSIFIEADNQPIAGGTVETKDFAFGSPPVRVYADRIKVDWECRTNATTDAIQVNVSARDNMAEGIGVSSGPITPGGFVPIGTLTGGASEISFRAKGKYLRFQFVQVSGHARIRGFSIRWSPASDVKTP